ncbi:MAG: radical SAM protein [Elusimicrobia bacterium]|nr:radical SAM protein [Elusimicrobiota bacterium]
MEFSWDMLTSINLSLSSTCSANCIYCPGDRGKNAKQKHMSLELAKKIVDEICSQYFKEKHKIERFEIGENGDAFLNKDVIKILRYVKSKLPEVKIEVYTNFLHLTKEKTVIILSENLIDRFHCNIDGSNSENYFYVKRADYKTFEENLIDFLEIRKQLNNKTPLFIHVLTLRSYINTVRYHLGTWPIKLKDKKLRHIKDDFAVIKRNWEKLIDSDKDRITRVLDIFLWAERDNVDYKKIDFRRYSCSQLGRIRHEAFISAGGTWYACCYDSKNELVLGNVNESGIDEIYESRQRKEMIQLLENKEFQAVGGPCKTVNCCEKVCYLTFTDAMLSRIKERFKTIIPRFYETLRSIKHSFLDRRHG